MTGRLIGVAQTPRRLLLRGDTRDEYAHRRQSHHRPQCLRLAGKDAGAAMGRDAKQRAQRYNKKNRPRLACTTEIANERGGT
jgi:hypothetical protein